MFFPLLDLTYDWRADMLWWIEPDQSFIRTMSLITGRISTIYSNLKRPTSLTIDAQNGLEIFQLFTLFALLK